MVVVIALAQWENLVRVGRMLNPCQSKGHKLTLVG